MRPPKDFPLGTAARMKELLRHEAGSVAGPAPDSGGFDASVGCVTPGAYRGGYRIECDDLWGWP
jgi:hypothetical protein